MKKLFALLVAVLMMFAFAGCGGNQEEAPAPEEATEAVEEQVEDQVEEAVEEQTEKAAEQAEEVQEDIGVEMAKEIALSDAGFAAGDVEFTKAQQDIDDGLKIYEVEFVQGETKYEYDIDAQTGEIVDRDTDSVYDD